MSYSEIKKYCDDKEVSLIAVSKTKPIEAIKKMYDQGQRDFGENKVQELVEKNKLLPADINWHFIGHLQRNKVKQIIPFVSLIHSVDSLKLLNEINKQAEKIDRVVPILLQFHIAQEESKFGLSLKEAEEILNSPAKFANVTFSGVMGMATFTDNLVQIKREFATLRKYSEGLKEKYFAHVESFHQVSMGMSGDYKIAIEQGSTMVRIGSLLFGARNY